MKQGKSKEPKVNNAYYELYCKNLPGLNTKTKKKKLEPIQKSGTAGGLMNATLVASEGLSNMEKRKRSKIDTTSAMSQTLKDYNKQIQSINDSL